MSDRIFPRIVEVSGERSIEYGSTQLYHPSKPAERSRRRAERIETRKSTIYLLASPLLWYGIDELLASLPNSSQVIALEADEKLRKISDDYFPSKNQQEARLHYLQGEPDRQSLFSLLRSIGIERFRSCRVLSLNGGYRLHAGIYSSLAEALNEEIAAFWKNKMTLIHMAPLWIKNIFSNIALYHRHIFCRLQFPELADRPVLVVGAGESSEKLLAALSEAHGQELRGRLYVIAVDTAVAALYDWKIIPDAVVAQEGQFYNFYDFLPVAEHWEEDKRPRLFLDLTGSDIIPRLRSSPEQLPAGSCSFFASSFFPNRLFDRLRTHGLLPPLVPPLGSVGSTAVELALRCSTGPVYVSGLDFSFHYGKSHMRGAPLLLREHLISDRLHPAGSSALLYPEKSVFHLDEERKPALLSTGLLSTYAASFSRHFASYSDRIFLLNSQGHDLGLPHLSLNRFFRDLAGVELSSSPPGPLHALSKDPRGRERVRNFLKEEKALLSRLYDAGSRRLSGMAPGPSDSAGPAARGEEKTETLEELYAQADYLFLHFPDTGYDPPKKLEPDMLKRLLVSAGHYLRIIDRALGLL
jgi:hypothetical protein